MHDKYAGSGFALARRVRGRENLHLPAGCMAGTAMHELSLCESILQVMEQQAETQQYCKVKTV
jgi:hypothetical protein